MARVQKAYLLEAWEECLAPNARALARTILTLCAPLDEGETPGSLEVTQPQGHGFGETVALSTSAQPPATDEAVGAGAAARGERR